MGWVHNKGFTTRAATQVTACDCVHLNGRKRLESGDEVHETKIQGRGISHPPWNTMRQITTFQYSWKVVLLQAGGPRPVIYYWKAVLKIGWGQRDWNAAAARDTLHYTSARLLLMTVTGFSLKMCYIFLDLPDSSYNEKSFAIKKNPHVNLDRPTGSFFHRLKKNWNVFTTFWTWSILSGLNSALQSSSSELNSDCDWHRGAASTDAEELLSFIK
jgi:hypothetical protein